MIEINHSYRFAGQVVIVRSSYVTEGGRVGFIVEYSDGSFSRVGAASLTPIEPEKVEKKSPSLSVGSSFMRQGTKKRNLFR